MKKISSRLSQPAPPKPIPWWCSALCWNRDVCHGVALYSLSRPSVALLFLYATRKPLVATFLRMVRYDRVLPSFDLLSPEVALEMLGSVYTHEFTCIPCEYFIERDLPFLEEDDVNVLTGIRFVGSLLVTDLAPEPLEAFLARRQCGQRLSTVLKIKHLIYSFSLYICSLILLSMYVQ